MDFFKSVRWKSNLTMRKYLNNSKNLNYKILKFQRVYKRNETFYKVNEYINNTLFVTKYSLISISVFHMKQISKFKLNLIFLDAHKI